MAGGDSRRMGTDKASLLLDGRTLLQSVIATMQQIFPKSSSRCRQPAPKSTCRQVCDEQENAGPLAGLVASSGKSLHRGHFAVACDMPFVVRK